MGSVHVEVRFQTRTATAVTVLGCWVLPSSERSLKRPNDNSQSPEQGGGSRCRRNFKGMIPKPSIHLWSAPRGPVLCCLLTVQIFYAAALADASAAGGRSAFFLGAFGKAWRNGSYTSPLTQRQCSNTASFRATATTARFLAFFPPRSLSRSP